MIWTKDMPIGFLDSGVGGLSVMREAIKIMPNENYIYFGDSKMLHMEQSQQRK